MKRIIILLFVAALLTAGILSGCELLRPSVVPSGVVIDIPDGI